MKLHESTLAQRTGYKNSSTSVDILDWVSIGGLFTCYSTRLRTETSYLARTTKKPNLHEVSSALSTRDAQNQVAFPG